MTDEIKIADLVASVDLDASGLEKGATKAERRMQSLREQLTAQQKEYDALGKQIDTLGSKLGGLEKAYADLSNAQKLAGEGKAIQKQIDAGVAEIDKMVAEYGKMEDAIGKTTSQINELGVQMQQTGEKKELQDELRNTNLELTAASASVRAFGNALGVDSQLLSAITSGLSVYKQAVNAAKRADDAHAAAAAAKNAVMSWGISLLILAAAKVVEYAVAEHKAAEQAAEDVETLADRVQKITDKYDQFNESLDESKIRSEAEIKVLDPLIDEYDKLNNKEKLSADEKDQLAVVVDKLQQAYGDLGWQLDVLTGKWNINAEALWNNRDAMLANIEATYQYDKVTKAYETQQEIYSTYGIKNKVQLEIKKDNYKTVAEESAVKAFNFYGMGANKLQKAFKDGLDVIKYGYSRGQEYERLAKENQENYEEAVKALEKLEEAEKILDDFQNGGTSTGSNAAKDNFLKLADGLVEALENKYDKMLEAEKDAIQESINNWKKWEESNVSAIQEQIDALDALEKKEEAEQRAAELMQKADELAYQLRFETDEFNRQELQKQLNAAQADYEKEMRDQERDALKESLQAQIDTIKATSSAEQEALKSALEATEKAYAEKTDRVLLNAEAEKLLKNNSSGTIKNLLKDYNPSYFASDVGSTAFSSLGADTAQTLYQVVQNAAKSALNSAAAVSTSAANSYFKEAAQVVNQNKTVNIENITFNGNLNGSPTEIRAEMDRFADYIAGIIS